MPRSRRTRVGLARAQRPPAARARAGDGVLALRQRLGQAGALDRRAACGGRAQARFRRRHHRAHRGLRHRPRLLDAGRAGGRRTLGLGFARLRVVANDSAVTPKDNGSYSSRVSFMVGNAALDAARNLRTLLIEAAARKLEAAPADVECVGESYRVAGTDSQLSYMDTVTAALEASGTISVKGTYSTPPETQGGKFRGAAVGSSAGFSYAAQVVEVNVDEETGTVAVERVWVAHDCGFAINPLAVEGQIQGSVWMGMGQALFEETAVRRRPCACRQLARLPDAHDRRLAADRGADRREHRPGGPLGAKEAGEGSLSGFLPALTNAIADAIGLRLTELPASPDRVLEAPQHAGARCGCRRRATHKPAAGGWRRCRTLAALSPCIAGESARGTRAARRETGGASRRRRHRPDHQPAPRPGRALLIELARVSELDGIRSPRGPAWGRGSPSRALPGIQHCAGLSGTDGSGAVGGRAVASRGGDAGRQPVPRHALRVLQPEPGVAPRQRLLPQVRRRYLSRRTERPALPRGIFRRPRPGADGLGAEVEIAGPAACAGLRWPISMSRTAPHTWR